MVRLLIASFFLLVACQSDASRQRIANAQKQREDSIRIAVENETRIRIERKNLLEDSIRTGQSNVTDLRNQLILSTGDLAAAKDKLTSIKGYQFLRTDAERTQQIKDQTIIIMSLENQLSAIQQSIQNASIKIENWKQELSLY